MRVRAADGAERSAAWDEVVLLVPGALGTLSASVANRVVSLAWGAVSCAASYVIEPAA